VPCLHFAGRQWSKDPPNRTAPRLPPPDLGRSPLPCSAARNHGNLQQVLCIRMCVCQCVSMYLDGCTAIGTNGQTDENLCDFFSTAIDRIRAPITCLRASVRAPTSCTSTQPVSADSVIFADVRKPACRHYMLTRCSQTVLLPQRCDDAQRQRRKSPAGTEGGARAKKRQGPRGPLAPCMGAAQSLPYLHGGGAG
jgi:hypothetical protein